MAQANWWPTRLLDVGTPGNPYLRLRVNGGATPASVYTTLSHCWGQLQIKQLKIANLLALTKEIEITELPKTFQDAITITRRIGVRYIWIDSLCIIQDSPEDWAKESSSMGNIYKNGLCNIAATAANDGQTGLFFQRNPLLAQRCRISIKSLPSFLRPGLYDLFQQYLWDNSVSEAPLNQRAWVIQERILAPRVIHFGKNQLLWECSELVRCSLSIL
jgi:hypothetical protein